MDQDVIRSAQLLIVDDEEPNLGLLEFLLRQAGFHQLTSTTDPRHALPLFQKCRPDLVLLDLGMPHLDGFAVLSQLRARIPADGYLPILVLTGDDSPEARQRALSEGARDFLRKPFDPAEVVLRIRNLLETRFLYLRVQQQNQQLEEKVLRRTEQLQQASLEILERLARAAEYRDDATGHHTERVAHLCCRLAGRLGLPDAEVELIRRAAPLHDVGKIGVPDEVLLKPGKLTAAEFEVIKSHTLIGARILSGSRFPLLQLAEEIALTHHERWDGNGYSPGLGGEDIPLASRILAVADTFDAITHHRPYRPAASLEHARQEIEGERGRQFDPRVVDAFLALPPAELAA